MIKFDKVSKQYANGVMGLKNINLEIQDGEFVAIIGLSGAGKSTLLRTINGLNTISSGDVWIDDLAVNRAKKRTLQLIRRNIGMIFQQFNLVKTNTVQMNVLSGRLGYYPTWKSTMGVYSAQDYELVKEALRRVGLSDKLHTRSDELSGGQQQRVAIARTLVQQAKIILADEPVSALDPITSERIMSDLQQINRDLCRTVIINLHSVDLARRFATRIIGLRAGEVVFDGPVGSATNQILTQIYGRDILTKGSGE